MLTKNIRTHIMFLKDWRSIPITELQWKNILLLKEDKKDTYPLTLQDVDSWEIIYCWELYQIKEFWIKKTDKTISWARYICDYWHRHTLNEKCLCINKYWLAILFKSKLREMWYKVFYNYEITKEMQEAFLKQKQN